MRSFHMTVLLLISLGAAFMGVSAIAAVEESNSAIHEIEALLSALIIAVAAGAGYLAAVIDGKK